MEGWIKVHRKLLDNPITTKDSDYLAVWIYLLLNATHREYDTLFKGKRITLQKGQLITGTISIAKKLKINKDKVQRILKSFEIDKQIEQQTSNQNRLVSIVNWNEYQDFDKQNDKQVINECETTDKQVITNNNIKNIKNDKNNIYGQNEPDQEKWEQQFEQFYKQYPKKVKKQDVRKWFQKNKPSNELFSSMINSLEQFKRSEDWLKEKGQYIPYPTSWLNQKRWEDENATETKAKIEYKENTMTEEEYLKKLEEGGKRYV